MDLVIKQSISQQESVTAELVEKLYNLTKPDPTTGQAIVDSAILVGRLEAPAAYEDAVNFLNTQFSSAQDNGSDLRVTAGLYYIRFADETVLNVLLNGGFGDGVGITTDDAADKSISELLNNNVDITSFNEFKYFRKNNTNTTYKINNCPGLVSIDLSECTNYPGGTFQNLPNLEYFNGPNSESGVLTFPEGTTTIGYFQSFYKLPKLKHIIFPSTMRSFSANEFCDCPNIETITLNPGFETFGGNSLNQDGNGKLIISDLNAYFNITWAPINGHKNFFKQCPYFYLKDGNGDLTEITTITIPQTMIGIPSAIFWKCKSIREVVFHSDITSIGMEAFANCVNLEITDLNFPNLATLGSAAFYNTKVRQISNLGFINTLSNSAFGKCSLLSKIVIPASLTSIGSDTFKDIANAAQIHVPTVQKWLDISKEEGTFNKLYYLYYNNTLVDSITIPQTMTSLTKGMLWHCGNTLNITIPQTVTSIDDCCFGTDSVENSITIDDVNLPNLTTLGKKAFKRCKVMMVTDLGSITSIPSACFAYCKQLTSIPIPNSVTSIGANAFDSCSGLTSFTISDSVKTIGSSAFAYCYMNSIVLNEGLEDVGSYAFQANNFTTITFPSTLQRLSGVYGCVDRCGQLQQVIFLGTTAPVINQAALFYGVPNTCKIYVPDASMSAYEAALSVKNQELVNRLTPMSQLPTT